MFKKVNVQMLISGFLFLDLKFTDDVDHCHCVRGSYKISESKNLNHPLNLHNFECTAVHVSCIWFTVNTHNDKNVYFECTV